MCDTAFPEQNVLYAMHGDAAYDATTSHHATHCMLHCSCKCCPQRAHLWRLSTGHFKKSYATQMTVLPHGAAAYGASS
jgi:hypothetical protein